jgi:hypothetical protein
MPPSTVFACHRLFLFVELRWRYSSPLPREVNCNRAKVKIMLWPTVSRPACLGVSHSFVSHDQTFITVRQLWVCWYETPSLTIGRVCRSQLLLVITGAIVLGPESHGIHNSSRFLQPGRLGPCMYTPGTDWLNYTSRHWVSFSLPPTARRDTVKVLEPASTREKPQHWTASRHEPYINCRFLQSLHCCVRVCCGDHVIATEPFPSNGCLCWLHKSALSKYATIRSIINTN